MPEFLLYKSAGSISNKKVVADAFNQLEDGRYKVVISSYKKRSLPQNAYYWAAMLPMVKDGLREVGYNEVKSLDDAHEILKHLFLKRKLSNDNTGDEIVIPGSTAKLTTIEFNTFIDEVIRWAAEYLGIQIPLPNEPLVMFAEYDENVKAIIVE
jgi:hypothetical protein